MEQKTMLFIGLSAAVAAVIATQLIIGGDDPEVTNNRAEQGGGLHETRSESASLNEYQELERLLEETRAQRKEQKIALAQKLRSAADSRAETEKTEVKKAEVAQVEENRPEAKTEPTPVAAPQPSAAPETEATESPAPSLAVAAKEKKPVETSPAAVEVAKPKSPAPVPAIEPSQRVSPPAKEPEPVVATTVNTQEKAVDSNRADPAAVVAERKVDTPPPVPKVDPKPQPVSAHGSPQAKVDVKPEQPQSAKSAKPVVEKRRVKRGNHIQLAAYTNKARAMAVIEDLRDARFNVEIVEVDSRGKHYFLLRDYSPKNRESALELKKIYDNWLKIDSLVRY